MQECTGVKMSRRNLLAGAATIALINTKSLAKAQPIGAGATALPQQSEVVIRAAFIMTMDPSLGDLKTGDVHIVNGRYERSVKISPHRVRGRSTGAT